MARLEKSWDFSIFIILYKPHERRPNSGKETSAAPPPLPPSSFSHSTWFSISLLLCLTFSMPLLLSPFVHVRPQKGGSIVASLATRMAGGDSEGPDMPRPMLVGCHVAPSTTNGCARLRGLAKTISVDLAVDDPSPTHKSCASNS